MAAGFIFLLPTSSCFLLHCRDKSQGWITADEKVKGPYANVIQTLSIQLCPYKNPSANNKVILILILNSALSVTGPRT